MLQDHINKECVVHSEVHICGWNAPTQTVGIRPFCHSLYSHFLHSAPQLCEKKKHTLISQSLLTHNFYALKTVSSKSLCANQLLS